MCDREGGVYTNLRDFVYECVKIFFAIHYSTKQNKPFKLALNQGSSWSSRPNPEDQINRKPDNNNNNNLFRHDS